VGSDLLMPHLHARRVAVVGGGITGLAAANRLLELAPSLNVTLFEARDRLGGVLETVKADGFSTERSADNFITNVPWGLDLCRRIGFEDQMVPTNSTHRQAFVVRRGRLRKIPEGFLIMAPSRLGPIVATPILSPWGKLRLACEYFVPPRRAGDDEDESLADFAIRRLGREVYERLVQPLVGGIYTADPKRLSLAATMPRFLEMERQYGSLTRAALREAAARRNRDASSSGARYSMFVAPREGISSLIAQLAARLPDATVRCEAPVERMTRAADGQWVLSVGGREASTLSFDGLLVALPARQAGPLLAKVDSQLAAWLGQIPYAPCAIVSLGYRRAEIDHRLDGFGFVVPQIENRKILSVSFSSVKYPGRAPQGHELLRTFVGGACQSELVDLPDDALLDLVTTELGQLLGIRGRPVFQRIDRWPAAMPQYHLGHGQLVEKIERYTETLPGLALAGNAYHGVGMPHCIHSGEQAAEQIYAELDRDG
jgi:oxygen-dependent protoporphyrinogen oxidase